MPLFHEGRTTDDPGLSANQAWLPPTAGLRDWQSQMPRHDVELFEALAGGLLSELGYERGVETISPEVDDRSASCRRQWESEMARPRG